MTRSKLKRNLYGCSNIKFFFYITKWSLRYGDTLLAWGTFKVYSISTRLHVNNHDPSSFIYI